MARLGALLSRPAAVLSALAVMVAFMALGMPTWLAGADGYTPPGGAFDTSPYYTPAQAVERAMAYTDEGAAAYVRDRWTWDLAFPAVYGAFMLSAWAFALSALAGARGPRFGFLWIPLLGVCFDLCENASVTALMALVHGGCTAPAAALALASTAASVFTALKWLFVGTGFAGSLALPLAAGVRALARRGGARPGGAVRS